MNLTKNCMKSLLNPYKSTCLSLLSCRAFSSSSTILGALDISNKLKNEVCPLNPDLVYSLVKQKKYDFINKELLAHPTLFFFLAKQTKRSALFAPRLQLIKHHIRLVKIKNSYLQKLAPQLKLRGLNNLFNSTVMVGLSPNKLDYDQLKSIVSTVSDSNLVFLAAYNNNIVYNTPRLSVQPVNVEQQLLLHLTKMFQTFSRVVYSNYLPLQAHYSDEAAVEKTNSLNNPSTN
jgi:hypothetical protein